MNNQQTWKVWLGVVVLLALVVGGVIILVTTNGLPKSPATVAPVTADDWTTGNSGAVSPKLSLIEYSDFQCPACGTYYLWLKQLLKDVPEVALTYRNFPLAQHQNADLAARVAEAAGRQDKFWEMYDLIFAHQLAWSESATAEQIFTGYAQSLGLDLAKFKTDYNSDSVKAKVKNDFESGLRAGVNSTPTFFLNGKIISNPTNYNDFLQLFKNELAAGSTSRP